MEAAYEEAEHARLEKMAIGDLQSQIDFLREIFGEDLPKELVHISGVTLPTAKRWIGGGRMAWRNSQKIRKLAKMFYALERKHGTSGPAAAQWYLEGSPSARDAFHSSRYYIDAAFSERMEKLGISV